MPHENAAAPVRRLKPGDLALVFTGGGNWVLGFIIAITDVRRCCVVTGDNTVWCDSTLVVKDELMFKVLGG